MEPDTLMACQQLGFLATLFTVQPIFLRPVVHDTAIFVSY